jgi:hypothetical protein
MDGDVAVYSIKWSIRAVAYAAALLCLVLAVADLRASLSGGRWGFNVLFATLALGAAWFGTGVVTSDQNGVSKRFLWRSYSLRWEDISEVRLHRRDGGAIELRGSGKKLIVDSRFIAPVHLRHQIEQRTHLQPLTD